MSDSGHKYALAPVGIRVSLPPEIGFSPVVAHAVGRCVVKVDDYAAEQFRVLNGLAPGAQLQAGDRLKVVR
jgi:predicted Zn-dependent protease